MPDSDLEDLPEPITEGPEPRLRAKIMFFVAGLFLFGVAIILPPNNPEIKPTTIQEALAPASKDLEALEAEVVEENPDIFKIQNLVFDLKAKAKALPGHLDKIVRDEAKRLSEPIEVQAAQVKAMYGDLPTESAAVKAHATLISNKWFLYVMVGLFGIIVLEGILGVFQAPDNTFKALRRLWLVTLIPPMRMAYSPFRPNHEVWFPRSGWLGVNKESSKEMELILTIPMLLFTLSIVPIEIIERFFPHLVFKYPILAHALYLLGACIWIAFVVEFIMLFGLAQNKMAYCKKNWVNLLIIILPLLPLITFLRFLRITRIVRLIRAGKLMRVYRIRGVYIRAMRVAVLFSLFDRLLSKKPDKYLAKLEEKIEEKQSELAELEQNAEDIRKEIEASLNEKADGAQA